MVGLGASDLWWVGLSAFVAGMAGALALGVRAGMRKLALKCREAFVDWFGAAIDAHVAPKFDDIRKELHATAEATQENSLRAAEAIKADAARAAADVRKEMIEAANLLKTEQASMIHDEVAPIVARLDSHVTNDDVVMAAAGEALVRGQNALRQVLDAHHTEAMGKHAELDEKVDALDETVHEHTSADAENFARNDQSFADNKAIVEPLVEAVHRIEQRLDTDRPDQPTTTPDDLDTIKEKP